MIKDLCIFPEDGSGIVGHLKVMGEKIDVIKQIKEIDVNANPQNLFKLSTDGLQKEFEVADRQRKSADIANQYHELLLMIDRISEEANRAALKQDVGTFDQKDQVMRFLQTDANGMTELRHRVDELKKKVKYNLAVELVK